MMGFSIRAARKEDSAAIAAMFFISSEGLAAYIWGRMAEPGESPEAVGARRYAREGVPFSYENCLIAEANGEIAGMLHSFPMVGEQGEPESDPILRPYSELEDYGSLYVSSVAVREAFRGRGLGTALMAEAESIAKALGLPRVSLICFERNEGAFRLYERLGYREIMRHPLVPHPTLHYADGDAVLMTKIV
jgi:ribosomal protein S18 acetylase RimI-like enzyme